MKNTHPGNNPRVPTLPISSTVRDEESPATVRGMQRKIHRLEDILKQQESEIMTLKQLLISHSVEEHWEVPG